MKTLEKIKNKFGERNALVRVSRFVVNECFCLASLISPALNVKLRYRYCFGKSINLKKPTTFIEKCNWYKINVVNKFEIYRDCSDKLLVREYIHKNECDEYLNDLLAVYDSVDDIRWDELPNSFAMKLNDGCAYYIICEDKSKLDIEAAKRKLKKWWCEHNYLLYAEMQNKAKKRCIIVEKYIHGPGTAKQPIDYKFFCFNGKPVAVLLVLDRDSNETIIFMSLNWVPIPSAIKSKPYVDTMEKLPEKPKDFDKMVECAKKLSAPFPYVRVDMYQTDVGPIFGELTFTTAGGMYSGHTDPNYLDMAKLFTVPFEIE